MRSEGIPLMHFAMMAIPYGLSTQVNVEELKFSLRSSLSFKVFPTNYGQIGIPWGLSAHFALSLEALSLSQIICSLPIKGEQAWTSYNNRQSKSLLRLMVHRCLLKLPT